MRLPGIRQVRDAFTGEPVGRGERILIHLEPDSTLLLSLERTGM